MRLFERLKARADSDGSADDESMALRSIEQGNRFEDAGRLDDALQCYAAAVRSQPGMARAHLNLGNALLAGGDVVGAVEAFQTALRIDPNYWAAHYNLGNALARDGRNDAALDSYASAARLAPDFANTFIARANLLSDLGKLDPAIENYRSACSLQPGNASIHYLLGNALVRSGRLDEAADSYTRALQLAPAGVEALSSLAAVLHDRGDLSAAAACYRRALEARPASVALRGNLGNVYRDSGRFDDAIATYQRLLETQPGSAEAHNNLGVVLNEVGRSHDAMACFQKALELDAGLAMAHNNIGSALKDAGELEAAETRYRAALAIDPDYAEAASNLLFVNNYLLNRTPEECVADARRYGEIVAKGVRPFVTWKVTPEPDRPLRVGVMSGDLRSHPVGYFVEGVFRELTATGGVAIVAYSTHYAEDGVTERIRASCRDWNRVSGVPDEQLARRIRDDRVDVLIDLSGHTKHHRLAVFAWKPAPIQATWLGYFATTGVAAIDYVVADPFSMPPEEERNFTEAAWRLPETRLCFTPPDIEVPVGPLPASTSGRITFGCFSNLLKLNDEVLALWARVLASVPESRLFLKAKQLRTPGDRQAFLERFCRFGVPPERLILEGPTSRGDYLAAYGRIDIGLDPFPYPGGTTTAESLWMGVPVVTLAGERFLSRQGVALLGNAGLPDWIATDADDYVRRVATHAADVAWLAALRATLRQQVLASPTFDARRFARHFESALREMWQRWCTSSTAL